MNQIVNNATYESQMKMVTGPNQMQENPITKDMQKQLATDYITLYFSLSFANWAQGKTLGAAWYAGLEQIKQKVNATDANSPAGKYLRALHNSHSKKWSQVIMTSPHRNTEINCPPEQRQAWIKKNAHITNEALGRINTMIAKHRTAPTQNKATKYEKAINSLVMKHLILQKQTQQYA